MLLAAVIFPFARACPRLGSADLFFSELSILSACHRRPIRRPHCGMLHAAFRPGTPSPLPSALACSRANHHQLTSPSFVNLFRPPPSSSRSSLSPSTNRRSRKPAAEYHHCCALRTFDCLLACAASPAPPLFVFCPAWPIQPTNSSILAITLPL